MAFNMIWDIRVIGTFGLLMAAGCTSQPMLRLDDVVLMGQPTRISATVEHQYTMAFRDVLKDVEVTFTASHQEIGRAKSDASGRATLTSNYPLSKSVTIQAHATVEAQRLDASARVFHWHRDKTIVAVDFDECICDTDYTGLFIAEQDRVSKPIKGAKETLDALAKDYQLLYISARPRFLTDKTRVWLNEYHFPPGPIAHAEWFEACLLQEKSKYEMLVDLRGRWPNLLIGIGDKGADDIAYASRCGMLSLIVQPKGFHQYTTRSVLFKDWPAMGCYFQSNQTLFSNTPQLASTIANPNAGVRQLDPLISDIILTSSR